METIECDVLVVGAGPSGLAIAVACAREGCEVVCVAPTPNKPWTHNYGAWLEELKRGGHADVVETTWPRVRVSLGEVGERHIERAYCRIDTGRLQSKLLREASGENILILDEKVVQICHGSDTTTVTCEGERNTLSARVVIDASGAFTEFTRRHDSVPGFQVAYGRLLSVSGGHGLDTDEMTLMDFSQSFGDPRPTFLYAMPLSGTRVFVEETSLVAIPAMPMDLIRDRLDRRIESLGLTGAEVLAEERCVIPMGLGLPRSEERTIPYGAAASMVHPATGYLVARALSEAGAVAKAIASALQSGGSKAAARCGHEAIWPSDKRRTWMLYDWGMRTICEMDEHEIRRFFYGFFQVEEEQWMSFLSADAGPGAVAKLMWSVFCNVPMAIRWKLMTQGKLSF